MHTEYFASRARQKALRRVFKYTHRQTYSHAYWGVLFYDPDMTPTQASSPCHILRSTDKFVTLPTCFSLRCSCFLRVKQCVYNIYGACTYTLYVYDIKLAHAVRGLLTRILCQGFLQLVNTFGRNTHIRIMILLCYLCAHILMTITPMLFMPSLCTYTHDDCSYAIPIHTHQRWLPPFHPYIHILRTISPNLSHLHIPIIFLSLYTHTHDVCSYSISTYTYLWRMLIFYLYIHILIWNAHILSLHTHTNDECSYSISTYTYWLRLLPCCMHTGAPLPSTRHGWSGCRQRHLKWVIRHHGTLVLCEVH
jgi:hypothetical protein